MKGTPNWFKLDLGFKDLAEQIPDLRDESIGRAVRESLAYLKNIEDPPSLATEDPNAYSLYLFLRARVNEAFKAYESRVSNGNKGGRPAKNRTSHLVSEEEGEEEMEPDQDLFLTERKNNFNVLASYGSDDTLSAWRDIVSSIGEGVVIITDLELAEMKKFITKQSFRKYVRAVRNCIHNNKKYLHKTHAQAILEMAEADGNIINRRESSSFETDDYKKASLRHSFEGCGNDELIDFVQQI